MLTRLLGANWQTTLWGSISAIAVAIATTPALITFLPDDIENWIRGVAGLIAAGAGIKFAVEAKSKTVTGGLVQQTADGAVAAPAFQSESSSVADTKEAKPKL